MSEEMYESGVGPAGVRSGRRYTREEILAARRLGLVVGDPKRDNLRGPLYWAAGDYYPHKIAQMAQDALVVEEAIHREWDRIDAKGKEAQ